MQEYKFPEEFLWGTSTAGHQVEGNNKNTDWWKWENRDRTKDKPSMFLNRSRWPLEPSTVATASYKRYEEDFDLAVKLNNNAIRFGVEWARLEPEKGKFSTKEFNHYKTMIAAAKARGLKTFVTLHHFTSPAWLAELGGWTDTRTPNLFGRFAKKCAEEFGDSIDVYLTINEPQVYSMISYFIGRWPPQKTNPLLVLACQYNMILGHKRAYEEIKKIGNYTVGLVQNITYNKADATSINPLDHLAARFVNYLNSDFFLYPIRKHLDLIGLNFYFTNNIKNLKIHNKNERTSDLGWWLNPKGIKEILLNLKKYKVPIYITENGLADAEDKNRTWYINEILWQCAEAIEDGVPLKGYFHWSLIDNYEWAEGFWPRFGLVEIDRKNKLKRIPRPSFYEYAKICKDGRIIK